MYPGEHARTRWDEPAFIMAGSGEVVTFRQFDEASDRMAQLYRAQGKQAEAITEMEAAERLRSAPPSR